MSGDRGGPGAEQAEHHGRDCEGMEEQTGPGRSNVEAIGKVTREAVQNSQSLGR